MCEKNKENREEWVTESEKKLKRLEQIMHAEEEEKEIVQEILCDFNKYFNNNNACTNQQFIECEDLFRELIVK